MANITENPRYSEAYLRSIALPNLLDRIAAEEPDRILFSCAVGPEVKDGFFDLTFRQVANAINLAARWLAAEVGTLKHETIAYIGPQDVSYPVLLLAAAKTGHKMLFLSPRNSDDVQLALLEENDCTIFLHALHISPQLRRLQTRKTGLRTVPVPDLESLLNADPVPQYDFRTSADQSILHQPFFVLHTSGSTGIPKSVVLPHAWSIASQLQYDIPDTDGRHLLTKPWMTRRMRFYCTLPYFHAGGLVLGFACGVSFQCTIVLGPPDKPVSPTLVDQMHLSGVVNTGVYPSYTLQEISKSPEMLEHLRCLELAIFGGGPLDKHAGDLLSSYTRLVSIIGSTESGLMPHVDIDREDWQYFHFHPWSGMTFTHHAGDTYQAVVHRHAGLPEAQAIFYTFPELEKWNTGDLYIKHPAKPNLWRYHGRGDDVIVLSTGEKVNPLDIESSVQKHPLVTGALGLGQGQFQLALLVELRQPEAREFSNDQALDEIWPLIDHANRSSLGHAKIIRPLVLFADPAKPLLRTVKNTIQRSATITAYAKELQQLYASVEEVEARSALPCPDPHNEVAVRHFVKQIILQQLQHAFELEDDQDIFTLGADSLQVLGIVRKLNAAIHTNPAWKNKSITAGALYGNTKVSSITRALCKLLEQDTSTTNTLDTDVPEAAIRSLVEKYSLDMVAPCDPSTRWTVVLTGSTGSFGAYMLDRLMSSETVESVICFNRSADAEHRQTQLHQRQGLNSDWGRHRVRFHKVDLGAKLLGLPPSDFKNLADSTTHVIHNAWQVNFNLGLDSFERPHIAGIRHLVYFCTASPTKLPAHLIFISSIGSVARWNSVRGDSAVPEEIHPDPRVAAPTGYGLSKYVAEQILDAASRSRRARTTIIRMGQIAGPLGSKGQWNPKEWLPILIKSSKHMGLLPETLTLADHIDWVPVDKMASATVEIIKHANTNASHTTPVYHAVNPATTSWAALLPSIQNHMGENIKIVPYPDWVSAIEEAAQQAKGPREIDANPAIKLLDFWKGQLVSGVVTIQPPRLELHHTIEASPTLSSLPAVSGEWLALWMKQWEANQ